MLISEMEKKLLKFCFNIFINNFVTNLAQIQS